MGDWDGVKIDIAAWRARQPWKRRAERLVLIIIIISIAALAVLVTVQSRIWM